MAKKRRKKKKKRTVLSVCYSIIVFCLVVILLISAYKVGTSLYKYWHARNDFEKVAEVAKVDKDQFTGVIDFDALRQINPDVVGWIYQEDTIINYPILRGTDNEKYLHTDLEGKYSVAGSIFLDARNSADFSDFNSIVYGHHMNDGSMFKSLRGYTKEQDYYDTHKTFELITPDEKYHLVVIASYITEATGSAYTYSFANDSAKQAFLDETLAKSAIRADDTSVSVEDRFVTLSTCAYDFEQARYVVVCKMVPWTEEEVARGEELQATLDANN